MLPAVAIRKLPFNSYKIGRGASLEWVLLLQRARCYACLERRRRDAPSFETRHSVARQDDGEARCAKGGFFQRGIAISFIPIVYSAYSASDSRAWPAGSTERMRSLRRDQPRL
jgi:hypothetical protein